MPGALAARFMLQVFLKRSFGPARFELGTALLLPLVCTHSNGDLPKGDTLREGGQGRWEAVRKARGDTLSV